MQKKNSVCNKVGEKVKMSRYDDFPHDPNVISEIGCFTYKVSTFRNLMLVKGVNQCFLYNSNKKLSYSHFGYRVEIWINTFFCFLSWRREGSYYSIHVFLEYFITQTKK